ncbi:hypothetical protein TruAng_008844 [Truncatella angustata]|nr:hypothetical protein TruAng_008844 [Truncatella angustata]
MNLVDDMDGYYEYDPEDESTCFEWMACVDACLVRFGEIKAARKTAEQEAVKEGFAANPGEDVNNSKHDADFQSQLLTYQRERNDLLRDQHNFFQEQNFLFRPISKKLHLRLETSPKARADALEV